MSGSTNCTFILFFRWTKTHSYFVLIHTHIELPFTWNNDFDLTHLSIPSHQALDLPPPNTSICKLHQNNSKTPSASIFSRKSFSTGVGLNCAHTYTYKHLINCSKFWNLSVELLECVRKSAAVLIFLCLSRVMQK